MIGEWVCCHFTEGLFNNKEMIKSCKINKNIYKNYTNLDRTERCYYFQKNRLVNNFKYFNFLNCDNNSLKYTILNSNTISPTTIEEIE